MWHTIEFADAETYKIHSKDLILFSNTGIWDILGFSTDVFGTEKPFYIPRYINTFCVFMHCLRNYEVDLKFVMRACSTFSHMQKSYDPKTFLKMIISDNEVYKVHKMQEIIEDLAYIISPKILSDSQLKNAYDRKSIRYKEKTEKVYQEIVSNHELEETLLTENISKYMPHRYLMRKMNKLNEELQFRDFKNELDTKLPIIICTIIEIIAEYTNRTISPNFAYNIKQRIKNDPNLAKELYAKFKDNNILSLIRILVSSLSAFADFSNSNGVFPAEKPQTPTEI
jgi:hypothetical protein